MSSDKHPQYEVEWDLDYKPAETVDAEEWIAKKGITAKGKKCSAKNDIKAVRFIEPLVKEDDEDDSPKESAEDMHDANLADQTPDDTEDETYEEPTLF